MCVRIPEDAVIDPKFGSWTSSFLTQRRDAPAAQRSGWVSAMRELRSDRNGGPLDSRRGVILSPPNLPGWDDVPVVRFFEARHARVQRADRPTDSGNTGDRPC